MDRHSRWIAICMLLYFILPLLIDAKEIYCFKKIHNAQDKEGPICRGLINKSTKNGSTEKSFKSPRGCCKNGGVGYAQELTQLGKRGKKYRCLICTYKKSNGKKKLTTAALQTTEAMDVTPKVMTKDLFVTRAGQTGWTEWGPWTECSVSCGIGTKRRQKLCLSSDCNNEVEETTSICVLRTVCPVDGGWGPWSKYSQCPVTCGGGNVTRQRRCNNPEPKNGGKECPGDAIEATSCSTNPCPVDGGWSDWIIGSCTVSCGRGRKQRNRTCTNPSPSNGGMTCQGTGSDYLACHLPKCPVDGGWSLWSSWNDCDSTCGHGTKTRTRECVAPKPKRGGENCTGSAFEEGVCVNLYPCQVNGGWSPWSAWGPCLARPCTGERGNTTRSRTCSNPLPQYGGTDCVGVSLEWQSCLNNEQCPVDGDWCAWGEYSPCLPHDTGEFKLKTRQCRCPAPESGGQLCPGIDFDIDKCPSTTTQSSQRCRRKTALLFDDTSENRDDLDGSGGYEDDEDC